MMEEEKERYCSKIQRNRDNLFGNSALGDNVLMAFETPDKIYAVLLLHSFEATGKWQGHQLIQR